MEMMVVLLIVAIIAAASAPMVTKKLSRNTGTGDSPWVFTGLENSIAYNMGGNDNSTVIIGATTVPNTLDGSTRLFIDSGNNASHIAFGNGNEEPLQLTVDPTGRIGFSNAQIPANSIAFGIEQELAQSGIIAIGNDLEASGTNSIAIGSSSTTYNDETRLTASGFRAISIGVSTLATGENSIAIGSKLTTWLNKNNYTEASGRKAIAIGVGAKAVGEDSIVIGGMTQNQSSSVCYGSRSIAIGRQAKAGDVLAPTEHNSIIAIGSDASATKEGSIAIGTGADANANWSTVLGTDALASKSGGIALGAGALAKGQQSIAIGNGDPSQSTTTTEAAAQNAIAIGTVARVYSGHNNSVAIGYDAKTRGPNQIVLGNEHCTVVIPGNLVVSKYARLSEAAGFYTMLHRYHNRGGAESVGLSSSGGDAYFDGSIGYNWNTGTWSDRRLKNVGEKYIAGLAELKKLDFFHFTFKDDKEKTPHVGVIAQDLEKVFPDAVTKGEDGYLRIRWEDMFYAVINAVKELDNKIAEIVRNITDINSKLEEQRQIIETQEKTIQEQRQMIAEQTKINEEQSRDIDNLIKRIEKLEGK